MKLTIFIGILFVAIAGTSAQSSPSAVQATLSQQGLNMLTNMVMAIVERNLTVIHIPDVSFDKDSFSGSITSITCNNLQLGTVQAIIQPSGGVTITTVGLSTSCTGNWNVREDIWPHPSSSGSVSVGVSQSSAGVGVEVTEQNLRPHCVAANPTCTIGSLSINFSGGVVAWILDLFKSLLTDSIKNTVQSSVANALGSLIDNNINNALSNLVLTTKLPFPAPFNITSIDYGVTSNPSFDSSYLGFQLQGYIVNTANPQLPPFPAPALPAFNPNAGAHDLQLFVSGYTPMSLYYVLYNAGVLSIVDSSHLPPSAPSLTVKTFTLFCPNITNYFPITDNMDIKLYPTGLLNVSANTSNTVFITVPLAFEFRVQTSPTNASVAFTMGCAMNLSVTPTLANMSLQANIAYLQCTASSLISSNVGTVYYTRLGLLIDILLSQVAIPALNKLLGPGIPLPSIGGMKFVNPSLSFGAEYVMIATNLAPGDAFLGLLKEGQK
eukprot:PhF_6_TR36187/c0_g1_i3/m.52741